RRNSGGGSVGAPQRLFGEPEFEVKGAESSVDPADEHIVPKDGLTQERALPSGSPPKRTGGQEPKRLPGPTKSSASRGGRRRPADFSRKYPRSDRKSTNR